MVADICSLLRWRSLPRWLPRWLVVLVLALSLGIVVPHSTLARAPGDSFSPLVKRVLPAVVNISVAETTSTGPALPAELRGTPFERQFRERFGGRRERTTGAGSGFIIDPAGFIVTNRHVVGRADRITVALSDGTELPAKLIGADELTDIALIKIEAPRPLPFVAFGDSRQVEVGDWVIAAGNPFGLGGSVSAGIISARGRDLGAGPFDDFLQLDAPINPGNSGGPTFNMDGQVIGVNTAIVSPSGGSVGIGFAVPSEIAARIVQELRDKGRIERGWLGVSLQELQTPSSGIGGVGIAGIERTGPAARSGLRPGDVVLAADGAKVETARELIRVVARKSPGANVALTVRRQGRDVEIPVTVGRRPPTQLEE